VSIADWDENFLIPIYMDSGTGILRGIVEQQVAALKL
jgi:hypothetical protein